MSDKKETINYDDEKSIFMQTEEEKKERFKRGYKKFRELFKDLLEDAPEKEF